MGSIFSRSGGTGRVTTYNFGGNGGRATYDGQDNLYDIPGGNIQDNLRMFSDLQKNSDALAGAISQAQSADAAGENQGYMQFIDNVVNAVQNPVELTQEDYDKFSSEINNIQRALLNSDQKKAAISQVLTNAGIYHDVGSLDISENGSDAGGLLSKRIKVVPSDNLEVVDLNGDTTASNIPAFDTTLDNTILKETAEPTSELTPEQIYEENKKGTVFDLIDKYRTEDGGKYPVEFVVSILKNAANQGNANAAQILSNTPVAGPEGAFDGDGPAAGTGDPAASGAEGTGTPTGGTPQGQTSTPQGSTPTPQGGTPQGGTPTSDTPAVDSPIDTPTVSTGSVLDQTGTGDVKVDDQPKGFLTGMTPQAQAIINEGNRSDITATMLGPFIAKQDVPIIPPLKFELKNVPQSDFAKALLTSDGLMRSFV